MLCILKDISGPYCCTSFLLGIISGTVTTVLLWKFSSIKRLYHNIFIGIGVSVAFFVISGIISCIKDAISRHANASALAKTIKVISKSVVQDYKKGHTQGYKHNDDYDYDKKDSEKDNQSAEYTAIEPLDYKKIQELTMDKINNYQELQTLSNGEKNTLQSIICSQVYIDWKYPHHNKFTTIKINIHDIKLENEEQNIPADILAANFISNGINDNLDQDSYNNNIGKINISLIVQWGSKVDYSPEVIELMKQYKAIKEKIYPEIRRSTAVEKPTYQQQSSGPQQQ